MPDDCHDNFKTGTSTSATSPLFVEGIRRLGLPIKGRSALPSGSRTVGYLWVPPVETMGPSSPRVNGNVWRHPYGCFLPRIEYHGALKCLCLLRCKDIAPLSLLSLKLHTGLRHQLRIHCAHVLQSWFFILSRNGHEITTHPTPRPKLHAKGPPTELVSALPSYIPDGLYLRASTISFLVCSNSSDDCLCTSTHQNITLAIS